MKQKDLIFLSTILIITVSGCGLTKKTVNKPGTLNANQISNQVPAGFDSDGDGLRDDVELGLGTDLNRGSDSKRELNL